jgi:benzodiazapine receptor
MTGIASRSQLRLSFLRYALVTVPLVLLLGTLSGAVANSGYGNAWFDALVKPDFMPPGWSFGVVWTLLYIMLGLALAMILFARGARGRAAVLTLFVAQLLLNYSWSPIFFAWHDIDLALSVVAAMVLLTMLLCVMTWRIRRVAALLLVPYLAWLCFAAALTAEIQRLNPEVEVAPQPSGTDIVL